MDKRILLFALVVGLLLLSGCAMPVENCGDSICSSVEKATGNCPGDCLVPLDELCGDGVCSAVEKVGNCPVDCV